MSPEEKRLVNAAIEARKMAYAPYSNFGVGAAIEAASGRIYTGCNVESASYGATICAERSALCAAIAAGEREFLAIAVAARTLSFPCGICRQCLVEFSPDMNVIAADLSGAYQSFKLSQLLPCFFGSENLKTQSEVKE
ncbi:MAG: cytidine deaminase [Christensenellales bacterium]|jgi:cytidine deaminase